MIMNKAELNKLKINELKQIAKDLDIEINGLKKDEIILKLSNYFDSEEEKETIIEPDLTCEGILEVLEDGFGFLRGDNMYSDEKDVFVSPSFIRKLKLRTGDYIIGKKREPKDNERYESLTYIDKINYQEMSILKDRPSFESLTPIFPKERIKLERPKESLAMRIVDLVSPIGKGQRGLIVAPPKAGKTTLLKDMAISIRKSCPEAYIVVLLIDERPEEVTDIKETIAGENVKIIYSTFDEKPTKHKKVAELTIEYAKRLVEVNQNVVILLDSITRLARAYNLTEVSTGKTLSGGLDPNALYMPKKFFGAARNTKEKGSLTILATALIDTGSKMDDVIYEEFKGTGNMELLLSRKLQERRVFPAIDILKSGTRREDLLLNNKELLAVDIIRNQYTMHIDDLINLFIRTSTNEELINYLIQREKNG